MRLAAALAAVCLSAAVARAEPPTTAPATAPSTTYARTPDRAVADGVRFLVADQNPDGSWGTGTVSHGNEIMVSVPASHEAFRSAVTALCVMALREAGEHAAHDRGVRYLLAHPDAVRRGDAQLIYNTWAHTYVTQALAAEAIADRNLRTDPRLRAAVVAQMGRMKRYECYAGGWNYYDFDAQTQRPGSGGTSFGTAAGLVALAEAKRAGFPIDQPMADRAILKLEQMRQPNGAYLYDTDLKYRPTLPANLPRGSLGRSQAGNYALRLWDSHDVDAAACRRGLDFFFADHAAIEGGRKRPMPHTGWYQTSGYYFYFDHYYAARLIDLLDARATYGKRMLSVILPHQEPDGSWWDYPMWDYHKPYGTAFAIMTVLRCK